MANNKADFSGVTVEVNPPYKPLWLRQSVADLARHEGFREFAYPDPLSPLAKKYKGSKFKWGFRPARDIMRELGETDFSKGAPWTVGYGQTHGVTPDSTRTEPEAKAELELSTVEHVKDLHKLYPNWQQAPLFVSSVLVNMIYNMGYDRFSKFQPTINVIKAGRYVEAAGRLKKTPWYTQTGYRAQELTQRLERQSIAPHHRVA